MSQEISAESKREIEKMALKAVGKMIDAATEHYTETIALSSKSIERHSELAANHMAAATGLQIRVVNDAIDKATTEAAK